MPATIKDIQKHTGLGLATISKYINGGAVRAENRALLDRAIAELGYKRNEYARALKTNRSRTVGVLIPELSSLFCTTIISSVEDALRQKGYAAVVCDCRSDVKLERQAVDFLLSKKVDGILNLPVSMSGRHLKDAAAAGVPVVLIDRMVSVPGFDTVVINNRGAASEAIGHLASHGHRRIGLICGGDGVYTFRERRLGCRDALAKAGIAIDPALDSVVPPTLSGGYEGMKRLLKEAPGITAVFVTNYEMTLGAVIAAREMGVSIPGALSFIGFDNMELSRVMTPRLTTVAQPMEGIASEAADLLLRAMEGENSPRRTVILETHLNQGDSVLDIGL